MRVLALFLVAAPAMAVEPLVPRTRDLVKPLVEAHLVEAEKAALAHLAKANDIPAHGKTALRQQAVGDPWGALVALERRGLDVAEAAGGGLAKLPDLVQRLAKFRDLPPVAPVEGKRPKLVTLDDHAKYIIALLDAAAELRENALLKVAPDERAFLVASGERFVKTFGPQESLDANTKARLESDVKFVTLGGRVVDSPAFLASALTMLRLAEPAFLESLRAAMKSAPAMTEESPPKWLGGPLLHVRPSKHGLIVFAGAGANRFDLQKPVAFLADLGGDDSYSGVVASSFDADHPFGMVVDFAGNDTYEGSSLGLATGRLGCGVLIDRAGDDTYKLAAGSGGCGFAGIGLLIDEAGKDKYVGSTFTQGVASVGIGLLLDLAGDDSYTAHGFSIGVGGPGGVGALIDVSGDDTCKCGKKIPSGYNASEAPRAKPGDANFQYDAFAQGIGIGRRIYPFSKEGDAVNLAGGVGVWLDLAGNDTSESSNFAQACAYFFGVGLKMDLAGNDRHGAARYGHASGAHYGLGMFLDYGGDDTYASDGPTYNGGCAWDRSVFLLADASGSDTVDFSKSSGPARGDHGGWSVFADLAGDDRYRIGGSAAGADDKSVAVFLDGGGRDEYPSPWTNGTVRPDGKGAVFADR